MVGHAHDNEQRVHAEGLHHDFPKKTFAQATSNQCAKLPDVLATGLSAIKPVKQGVFVSFDIPDSIYKPQLQAFSFAIIGRLMLKKGDAPRLTLDIQAELESRLKPSEPWKLINLGKGYFTLRFSCEADLRKISKFSSFRLSSGYLLLREWKKGFDPYKELSSVAQVWVRAYHLPAELWHPEVLAAVFRGVGNLIKFDGNTMSGNSGHFARALVEVDLSEPIVTSVMGNCSDGSMVIDISYEDLPQYCPYCCYVGHEVSTCKRKKRDEEAKASREAPAGDKSSAPLPNLKGDSRRAERNSNRKGRDVGGIGSNKFVYKPRFEAPAAPLTTSNAFASLGVDNEDEPNAEEVEEVPNALNTDNPVRGSKGIEAAVEVEMEAVIEAVKSSMGPEPVCQTIEEYATRQIELELRKKRIIDLIKAKRDRVASDGSLPESSSRGAEKGKVEDGFQILVDKITEALNGGGTLTDFEIDPGDFVNTRTMSNMVSKRWSDQVEEEEADFLQANPPS